MVHNVDILSNVNLKEFYVNSLPYDAKLLVSDRNSSRRLLFEPATLRLVGWTNLKTGEVLTPFKDLDVRSCKSYSFSGIHVISPQLLKEMCSWPEEFSIIDFYLDKCVDFNIRAEVSTSLKLLDVGKIETLAEADKFERELNL